MKIFLRKIDKYAELYRDDKSGIAWIYDRSTGLGVSVHPNIAASGSVSGMKALGYWGKDDRTVKSHGFIYNIDRLAYDPHNKLEATVSQYCMCKGCLERRAV